MSAIQTLTDDPRERRTAERLRVSGIVSVVFGRGEGILVDLSRTGARIRHSAPVRRGTTARFSFEWNRRRFSATAEVLAARVISLGTGPSYESRIRFTSIDPAAVDVLVKAIDDMTERDVRRWVANLQGWNEEAQATPESKSAGSFLRCRLKGRWWERKCTTDRTQPADGFLLPAESSEPEVTKLCETYQDASEEERQLIRTMAAAAVEAVTIR